MTSPPARVTRALSRPDSRTAPPQGTLEASQNGHIPHRGVSAHPPAGTPTSRAIRTLIASTVAALVALSGLAVIAPAAHAASSTPESMSQRVAKKKASTWKAVKAKRTLGSAKGTTLKAGKATTRLAGKAAQRELAAAPRNRTAAVKGTKISPTRLARK